MARGRVKVTGTTQVGARRYKVRKVSNLISLARSSMEATAHQNRVLAEETRELIIDRLMAAVPQPPGRATAERPPRLRQGPPTVPRSPYRHRKLKKATVRRKARLGLDGRKLIESGELIDGIEVFRGVEKRQPYYMVRMAPRKHKGSQSPTAEERGRGPHDITLNWLMRRHEFGTSRMPARPVWRPTARDIMAYWQSDPFRHQVKAAALRAALRSIG